MTNLDSSKLKELADNNFKFDENGRKLSKRVGNTEKRIKCLLRAISPFLKVFSKEFYCRQVSENQGLFGKRLISKNFKLCGCPR